MRHHLLIGGVFLLLAGWSATAPAQQFDYKPAGELEAGNAGRPTSKIWAPGMRFPILQAPAYANSQVWGHGGSNGPGGSQCDQENYSYPWYDNYCEPRKWDMPLCPGGTGHQGQDIRPKGCEDAKYWVVAAEPSTVIDDSGVAVKIKTDSGRVHRYLHLDQSSLVVNQGERLQPGDKIGKISTYTGGEYPTTIHLHYDFRQYVKTDPKDGGTIKDVVYVSPYMSLVDSYKRLIGEGGLEGQWEAEIDVEILNGQDRYGAGTSKDVPDFFPGETVEAAIYLKNAGRNAFPTETWLSYWFESPYLTPTSYQIDSDHPAYDQKSWMTNSADSADENPADGKLGSSGKLLMHAFSDGETKRVKVTLEAGPYSIGAVDHPDVRAWIQNMQDVYGTQDDFFGEPSNANKFGEVVRAHAQLDILSRDHWHFAGDKESEVEGWSAKDETEEVSRNKEDDLLAQHVVGEDAQLISPEWTEIEADAWDELVVRVRSHDGAHQKAVYWSTGDGFSESQKAVFEAQGDSSMHTYVIPVGEHEKWQGAISRLRIDLLDAEAPAEEDRGWYGLADVFLQSSADQTTNSERESYVDTSPTEIVNLDDGTGGGNPGTTDTGGTGGNGGDAGTGRPPGSGPDAGGMSGDGGSARAASTTSTSSSCSTTSGRAPVSWVWLLMGLFFIRRRSSRES